MTAISKWPAFLALLVLSPFIAQSAGTSTSESIEALQLKYEGIRNSVIAAIRTLPEHPESLETGTLESTLETTANLDLANLLDQLHQQKEILTKKKQALVKNQTVSQNDKKELVGALLEQSKPLESLISKISEFQGVTNDLRQSRLPGWKATYNSFKEIYGAEKASEKLRVVADQFCEPYAPPKPTATPLAVIPAATPPSTCKSTPEARHTKHRNNEKPESEFQSAITLPFLPVGIKPGIQMYTNGSLTFPVSP